MAEKRGSPWLSFEWLKQGAPEGPQPGPSTLPWRGFGSEPIGEVTPYELGGRGKVAIGPGGARSLGNRACDTA